MDNELIKIISKDGKQLVSARELHEFLEVKTKFNDWISGRINKYEFTENSDFILVTEKKVTNNPKNPITKYTDYAVTIDMAKELSMVENNYRGKKARKYFIKCEKELKKISPRLPSYSEALRQLADKIDENEKLQLENQELKPKAEFYDTVTESNETFDMSKIAKIINAKGIGRNKLFQILRDKKVLCKDNTPYQEYVDRGYFKLVEVTKGTMILHKTVVFQKGLDYIRKLISYREGETNAK